MANPQTKRKFVDVTTRDLHHTRNKKNFWRVKRTFDVIFSLILLICLSPVFLVIAILIKLDDPSGPIIYSQIRCGRGAMPFRIYKFRTMIPNADQLLEQLKSQNEMSGPAFKMRHDPRITRIGRVLRASNLDELPQLYNILIGNMSFVGPRPPLPNEVALYNEYQFQRLFVTPGLTCYWQIAENRNDLSFDKWLQLDLQYVLERSVMVDLAIIWQTVLAVFKHTGR